MVIFLKNLLFHPYCLLELSVVCVAITFAVCHIKIQFHFLKCSQNLILERGREVLFRFVFFCGFVVFSEEVYTC